MTCKCKRCGKPKDDCELDICVWCYLSLSNDDVKRNLVSGGRFYPSITKDKKEPKLTKEIK